MDSIALLFLALGLIVGSFLNVCIYRLPRRESVNWPASHCTTCSRSLDWYENVPVVSWLVLRGKCANCKAPISARYPGVEILTAALSVLVAWRFGYSSALAFSLVYVWALVALTFIDFDTQLLPDDITLPLLWLGIFANVFGVFTDLRSSVFGAIGGYLILWSVYWMFRLIAKKEGMGFGDFKLLAAIGAWLGWQVLPFVIVVSAGLGAILGSLALYLAKKGTDTRIPFGPYLALGGIVALIWGREAVIAWLGHWPA